MTDDEVLDRVIALWKQSDAHNDKADAANDEANREQQLANELEDQAEELWRPLADAHPEWFDALMVGDDPRVASHD